MTDHVLERVVGALRMRDLHHLDFVELVLADHAARVLAVAAGLRAEAWRVRGEPDRQLGLLEQVAAHRVGQRHLGRRDQVEDLAFALLPALARREQVLLELRQLTGADQRFAVDDVRRVALGVAVFGRLHVEHELRQCAMQPGNRAPHQREARTREFRCRVEVETKRSTEVDVITHREVERSRLAPPSNLDVVLGRPARGHRGMRRIRHAEQ